MNTPPSWLTRPWPDRSVIAIKLLWTGTTKVLIEKLNTLRPTKWESAGPLFTLKRVASVAGSDQSIHSGQRHCFGTSLNTKLAADGPNESWRKLEDAGQVVHSSQVSKALKSRCEQANVFHWLFFRWFVPSGRKSWWRHGSGCHWLAAAGTRPAFQCRPSSSVCQAETDRKDNKMTRHLVALISILSANLMAFFKKNFEFQTEKKIGIMNCVPVSLERDAEYIKRPATWIVEKKFNCFDELWRAGRWQTTLETCADDRVDHGSHIRAADVQRGAERNAADYCSNVLTRHESAIPAGMMDSWDVSRLGVTVGLVECQQPIFTDLIWKWWAYRGL